MPVTGIALKLPSTWVVVTLSCLQDAAMFAFDGESFFNLHLEILHCDSWFLLSSYFTKNTLVVNYVLRI